MSSRTRLLLVALCMSVGYQFVQLPAVREIYSAEDKWAHAAAFFAVWWALRWATDWRPMGLALLCAGLGGAVEVHQMFLPGFTPSWADWAADVTGIVVAMLVFAVWRRTELNPLPGD